jgi:ribosomal protein S27E
MSKAGKKMIESLQQAVAFARGDCDHEWITTRVDDASITCRCEKCGVRLTEPTRLR